MAKPTISKITIIIGDKEIELSPDEAKELHKILGEYFDKGKEIIHVPQPYPYPVYPWRHWDIVWTDTDRTTGPWFGTSEITITNKTA